MWPVALLAFTVTFVVDVTGVYLNLYRFDHTIIEIGGVPFCYLLSNSAFGILIVHFFPHRRNLNIPYILAVTSVFNGLQDIYVQFSYFTLLKMTFLQNLVLNLTVLTIFIYLSSYLFYHRLKMIP